MVASPALLEFILGVNEALHIGFKFKAYVVSEAFFLYMKDFKRAPKCGHLRKCNLVKY